MTDDTEFKEAALLPERSKASPEHEYWDKVLAEPLNDSIRSRLVDWLLVASLLAGALTSLALSAYRLFADWGR